MFIYQCTALQCKEFLLTQRAKTRSVVWVLDMPCPLGCSVVEDTDRVSGVSSVPAVKAGIRNCPSFPDFSDFSCIVLVLSSQDGSGRIVTPRCEIWSRMHENEAEGEGEGEDEKMGQSRNTLGFEVFMFCWFRYVTPIPRTMEVWGCTAVHCLPYLSFVPMRVGATAVP